MMSKTLGLPFLFLAITSTHVAAQSQANDAADIRAVMKAQETAWNRADLEGFMNGYARASHTTFVSGDTITRGWNTVLNRYKKTYSGAEKMGRLTFSDLEITPLGSDAALVLGRWRLKRTNDSPRGRFTLLFRRMPEGWRIAHDHTSAAEPRT
jgi:uncharacterized protein (TIGR02246 family)